MTSLFENIRNAAVKRAAYNRTVAELSVIQDRLAIEDLGFHPGDARQIANRVVYGR